MTDKLLALLMMTGVRVSAACLSAGLLWWLIDHSSGPAATLLATGLMLLMATPMLRVAVSVVAAVRARDWFYVWITIGVAAILAITVTRAAT